MKYVRNLAQREYRDVCLSISSQGPFKWDNKNDLGFSKVLGEWANELDQQSVIYFRRDKDAVWQERAQKVLSEVDIIADELSRKLGRICCSADSANGRKLPVYMPETGQEFAQVLENLCDGLRAPTNGEGCSVIQIGPLGCQDKGIVLHPDLFSSDGNLVYTLRKEMARYAYLSSVDYDEEISHPSWFTEGLIDYLAAKADTLAFLGEEITSLAEKELELGAENLFKGDAASKAGASFIQFLESIVGSDAFTDLIQVTFSEPLDSAFSKAGIDFQEVKESWINTLRGVTEELSETVQDAADTIDS